MKIIMCEGARNVGKTYLINSLDPQYKESIYKFPFVKYFNECFAKNFDPNDFLTLNSKPELFYFTLGYDIMLFDLCKKNNTNKNIISDRSVLSNLIFGIQAKRIDLKTAENIWNWIINEYKDYFNIVYIEANYVEDNRNKDSWTIYDQQETIDLYKLFITNKNINTNTFFNDFTINSEINFNKLIADIY